MQLGRFQTNNIYNEDSYSAIKDIPSHSIDLIVIDPPYLIKGTKTGSNSKLSKCIQAINKELEINNITKGIDESILTEFLRVLKTPNIYIWCNNKQIPMYLDFFVTKHKCNFEVLIWNKTNAMPLFNNKYLNDKEYCLYFKKSGYCNPLNYEDAKTVFTTTTNISDKNLFNHPTIKPLNIIETLIKNSSKENDIVADFFLGSGTTAVACKELNRQYIGFEINKKWFNVAQDRLNSMDANGQLSLLLR